MRMSHPLITHSVSHCCTIAVLQARLPSPSGPDDGDHDDDGKRAKSISFFSIINILGARYCLLDL